MTTNDAAPVPPGEPVYCICRKPDTGVWMIGCDLCNDWFHGSCVNISEEASKRFVKYACPRCEAAGRGHSTYKRKCRLPGCERPVEGAGAGSATRASAPRARRDDTHSTSDSDMDSDDATTTHGSRPPSSSRRPKKHSHTPGAAGKTAKYCCKEHGVQFFKLLVHQKMPEQRAVDASVLSPPQLAAAARACSSAAEFRALGSDFSAPSLHHDATTPPAAVTITDDTATPTDTSSSSPAHPERRIHCSSGLSAILTHQDRQRLYLLEQRKSTALARLDFLAGKARFLQLCKDSSRHLAQLVAALDDTQVAAAATTATTGKKKDKETCGFDRRLTRTQPEWHAGEMQKLCAGYHDELARHARHIIAQASAARPDERPPAAPAPASKRKKGSPRAKALPVPPPPPAADPAPPPLDDSTTICTLEKRKCIRHSGWQAIFTDEVVMQEAAARAELDSINVQLSEYNHRISVRQMELVKD